MLKWISGRGSIITRYLETLNHDLLSLSLLFIAEWALGFRKTRTDVTRYSLVQHVFIGIHPVAFRRTSGIYV